MKSRLLPIPSDPISWDHWNSELEVYARFLSEEMPAIHISEARLAIKLCRLHLKPSEGLEALRKRSRLILHTLVEGEPLH